MKYNVALIRRFTPGQDRLFRIRASFHFFARFFSFSQLRSLRLKLDSRRR